jgi:DNA-binding MurR/RpiR family transcriptional regulator
MNLIYPYKLLTHTSKWPIILQSDVTLYMPKTQRKLISASSSGITYLYVITVCIMYIVAQYKEFNAYTSKIIYL